MWKKRISHLKKHHETLQKGYKVNKVEHLQLYLQTVILKEDRYKE